MQEDLLCYSSCPARKYSNIITQICTACPYDCYTCDSNGLCLACNTTTDFRSLSEDRCVPLTGYYDNNYTMAVECPSGCHSCSSSTVCTLCQNNYYFISSDRICHSSCPIRFYPDNNTQSCLACFYDCFTCSSSGPCLSCDSTTDFRQLNRSTLRCLPLPGYF
jgi:proprotein convertase subtilisin/kexin type 5